MHRSLKLVLILQGALLATPALADEVGSPTLTEPLGGSAAPPGVVDNGVTAELPFWPKPAIDRPYTLPKNKASLAADFILNQSPLTTMTTLRNDNDPNVGFAFMGSYGITNRLTGGTSYAFPVNNAAGEGPLTFFAAYQITHALANLSVAVSVDYTYDFNIDTSLLSAGIAARYHFTRDLAAFTGAPFGPGPAGRQFVAELESGGVVDLGIPLGVMYQATRAWFLYADVNVATIHFNPRDNQDTVTSFNNEVPLAAGALFALSKNLDVRANGFLDASHPGDAWGVMLGGTWYSL